MELICAKCGAPIDGADVNVAADLAKCGRCDEVFKASELVADVDLSANLEPPVGSRITFQPLGGVGGSFVIPRRKFRASDVFPFLFATFWMGFIAFWTFMAVTSGAPIVFPLFSLIFWFVGGAMWVGLINGVRERQIIEIGPDALTVTKRRPFFGRTYTTPYGDIDSISVDRVMPRDPVTAARHMHRLMGNWSAMTGLPMPAVAHGVKKTYFAENVSEAEMKWLVDVLKAVVYKKTGGRV